jgi:hypothetical protein
MTDDEILAAVKMRTHVVVPISAAANAIVGRAPLDLDGIESEGEFAVYIDGITIDEAGVLARTLLSPHQPPAPTSDDRSVGRTNPEST